MSLTRITSGVVSSNAISTEKLANGAIDSRQLSNGSIEVRHLSSAANSFVTTAAISSNLTANLIQLSANIDAVQSNVNSQRSNVNTVSSNIATGDANSVGFTANVEARRTANIAGAISSVLTTNLTASRALISGSGGKIEVSPVTSTELGYVDGVTSAIQTQIDDLTSNIGGLIDGMTFTGQVNMADDLVVTGNLVINGDTTTANSVNMVVQDRMLMLANSATGAPAADVGVLFNRGNQGNAAFFYDESATTFKLSDTKDPSSNTTLSPVTASNLDVGIVTAATLKYGGTDVSTAISDNAAAIETRRTQNIAGAVSSITTADLTASRALASSGSGKVEVSAVTATELGYLDGVSSAIQTQLDAKIATTTARANDFTTFDTLEANLFSTFARLNANINTVSGNVALGLVQKTNSITSTGGNTFHVATPPASNPTNIGNVQVFIDGLAQQPAISGNDKDYVYNNSTGLVSLTDATVPSGLIVQITCLYPPS